MNDCGERDMQLFFLFSFCCLIFFPFFPPSPGFLSCPSSQHYGSFVTARRTYRSCKPEPSTGNMDMGGASDLYDQVYVHYEFIVYFPSIYS